MKKITYTKSGVIAATEESTKDRHVICIPGGEGVLEIGPLSLELLGGMASIHPSELPDGRYTPVLTYAGKSTVLQPLEKLGSSLYPAVPGVGEYSRFTASVEEVKDELAILTKRVDELALLVKGTAIFNIN